MRLHSLELAAIGPYATPQLIDFGLLTGSGLFLLEGPTGGGKTTILDAITFALYGGLSGDGAGRDRLHSDFADRAIEPSVTLEFSVRGERYQVRRVPEHQRLRKRGDGLTTQAMQVHLQRWEGARWVSQSSNKAEVGELITDAIGLSREQFTQVMLLPQGEFARFLRSDDDDRRQLLTRLFGTELYDRITAELDRGRRDAAAARQGAQTQIKTAAAAAAEAAGLETAEREELLALSRAERATRLKEVGEELARTIDVGREALGVAAASLAAAQTAAERESRQADLLARLAEAVRRLDEHAATRPEHEARVARLSDARRAAPVRPLLDELAAAEASVTAARGAVGAAAAAAQSVIPAAGGLAARAETQGGSTDAATLAEAAASLAASGVHPLVRTAMRLAGRAEAEGGAVDAAPLAADAARSAAAGSAEQADAAGAGTDAAALAADAAARAAEAAGLAAAAGARAEEAELAAAGLEHLVVREAGLAVREAGLGELRKAAAQAGALVARLEADQQELPGRIDVVDGQLSEARIAGAGLADALGQQSAVAARRDAAVEAAGLAAELETRQEAVRTAVDAHQRLVDAYQQAMTARLENMAAELAGQLADGEPCPVCGAPEHPRPASPLDDAVSADDVSEAEQLRDEAAAEREHAETARDDVAAELATASAAAGGASADQLAAELADLDERVRHAEQGTADAERLEPMLADLRAERDKLDEDLKLAAAARATAREQASSAEAELAGLRAELTAAAAPHPTVGARQAALRAAAAGDRTLADALAALAAAHAAVDRAAARAAQEMSAGGFASLTAARAAVLPPAGLAALDEQVTGWTATLAALTAGTRDAELAGLDPADAAAARQRADAAATALTVARAAEQEVRDRCQELTGRERRLRDRLAELEMAEQEADRIAEQTDPVLRLAGLARGMDGQRRIALTTYVLRRWFEQVVEAANVRLAAMSAGRYELTRTDETALGERKNQRTGLTLAVIDRHTGERRSPKSLSGGETFYTSLALALGLADVVRAEAGGVELDTLFIDEGFGSLDADTLDQVMTVIDDLRDRGRAVGIVSHVADLKDRVYERLEVRRLADGSSVARVVA